LSSTQFIIKNPRYLQNRSSNNNTELDTNFTNVSLLLWNRGGYDSTRWLGAFFSVFTSEPSGANSRTIILPLLLTYNVEFSGIRWVNLSPPVSEGTSDETDQILGYDDVENPIYRGKCFPKPRMFGSFLQSLLGSTVHSCPQSSENHQHWLVVLSKPQRRSCFPQELRENCWIRPVEKRNNDTIHTAVQKYTNYIKGKGKGLIKMGKEIDLTSKDANKRTKTEIRNMILEGQRTSYIMKKFPHLTNQIFKLARLRPQRTF